MKKRGQVSVEFITIFSFSLVMLIPLVIIFYDQIGDTKDSLYNNQIYNIVSKIVDKSETIFYYGQPSKTTLKAFFPDNIENVTIKNREIIFNFRNSQNSLNSITLTSLVNVSGTISRNAGIHYIVIEAKEDHVYISG